jgi:hypothetical protein
MPTKQSSSHYRSSHPIKNSARAASRRKETGESSTPGAADGFSSPSPAVAALDQTSCSRFDLNALLRQLAHDFQDTMTLQVDLHDEPMPVFANIGHLSYALQELLKFLAASAKKGETISLGSARLSAEMILKHTGNGGHFLFPVSSWNMIHSSQRAFAIIKMLKTGAAIPEVSVARFLKSARSMGHAKHDEAGIQRLGRVFRKHRINLHITSTESVGTIFQLFILLADVGK